jgi:hypothetical protein
MFGRLLKFREAYHHCLVPASYGDGTLSNWCEKNRAKKKAGTLKAERERALNEIGFDWSPRESKWQVMYQRLKQYRAAHGHCCPPRSGDDRQLTNWVFEQRFAFASGRLSEERKQELDELGFVFDVREASWLEQYYHLRSFYQRYGHVDVPESSDAAKLVSWIRIQRMKYSKGKLEKRKVEMLNELGMSWDPRKEAWEMRFARLQRKCKSGRSVIGSGIGNDSDSRWIQKQRARYRKGTLDENKIKKLESLGISWAPDEQFWNSMYEKLASCIDENGKSHVSYAHSDRQLFIWVTNQRALKRKGLLSFDRIRKLDAIGFVWDPVHPGNRRQTLVRRNHPE